MSTFTRRNGNRNQFRTRYARGAAGKPTSKMFMRAIGVAGLLVAGLVFYIGWQAPNTLPFRSYYTVWVKFPQAQNLEDHYQVRIGGLLAGQVLNMHVVHGLADVELQLGGQFKPLRSDTRVQVRLRSAVGIRYVDVFPGTRGTPLPNGATIAPSHVIPAVALDQVLGTFNAPTRLRTQQLLQELGGGMLGRGADLGGAIQAAPAFLHTFASVSSAITAHPGAMSAFIRAASAAAAEFNPVRDTIATGFQPETQALQPFTAQSQNVQATLDQAPATLTAFTSQLPPVANLIGAVGNLAAEGDPTLALLPGALSAGSALLRDGQPALREAARTLSLAHTAVPPAVSLLQDITPVEPDMSRTLGDLLPTITYIAPRYCELSNAWTGWSSMMKYGTSYDNFIRFYLFPTGNELAGGTGSPLVPVVKSSAMTNPYPGPCVNGDGEVGPPKPLTATEASGATYSNANPPIGPVPDFGSGS
jgi:ABC-type transporter Mla subunit MlaD